METWFCNRRTLHTIEQITQIKSLPFTSKFAIQYRLGKLKFRGFIRKLSSAVKETTLALKNKNKLKTHIGSIFNYVEFQSGGPNEKIEGVISSFLLYFKQYLFLKVSIVCPRKELRSMNNFDILICWIKILGKLWCRERSLFNWK